jgi:hypothetical protein
VTRAGTPDRRTRPRARLITDDELLWIRLFRTLDDIDGAIDRLERTGPDENLAAVGALERLRCDIVSALRLAAGFDPEP